MPIAESRQFLTFFALLAFLALFAEFAKFLLECLIFFAEGFEFAFGVAGFGAWRFFGLDLLHEFLFGVGEFAFHGFGALTEFVGEVVHFGGFEVFGGGANVFDVTGEDFESFSLRAEFGRNFRHSWGYTFEESFDFCDLSFDVLETFAIAVCFGVAGLSE
jgi:hypothetical protein